MIVEGVARRSIWLGRDGRSVEIIDQTRLPHEFVVRTLVDLDQAAEAISAMWVRGAPLIGVTAAYGVALQMNADASDASLAHAVDTLAATRPTAVNLRWALEEMKSTLAGVASTDRSSAAYRHAGKLAEDDVETCRKIGEHGVTLIEAIAERRGDGGPIQILTHCNAGWLATVDWGTALSAIYRAHDSGIPVHVWVDETRPRNQGASLTAWELGQHGVPHTVIADNAGGHLMQHGRVDLCITGSDRTTATGDVCNKIGTYLKALAAHDNGVPFYAALPHSTIDWDLSDGVAQIPIEERDGAELRRFSGPTREGHIVEISVLPDSTPVANPAFDVTPARLVTGLITERGVCEASRQGLLGLYPERGGETTQSCESSEA